MHHTTDALLTKIFNDQKLQVTRFEYSTEKFNVQLRVLNFNIPLSSLSLQVPDRTVMHPQMFLYDTEVGFCAY